jgi:hypothetical protein
MAPGRRGDGTLKSMLGSSTRWKSRSTKDYIENETISVIRRSKHLPMFQVNHQIYTELCEILFASNTFRFDASNQHWASTFLKSGFLSQIRSCVLEPTLILPTNIIQGLGSNLCHLTLIWDYYSLPNRTQHSTWDEGTYPGFEQDRVLAKVFVHLPYMANLRSLRLIWNGGEAHIINMMVWQLRFNEALGLGPTRFRLEEGVTVKSFSGDGNWTDTNNAYRHVIEWNANEPRPRPREQRRTMTEAQTQAAIRDDNLWKEALQSEEAQHRDQQIEEMTVQRDSWAAKQQVLQAKEERKVKRRGPLMRLWSKISGKLFSRW